jgi:multidrug efflux pump subunit AcrA (membrane-fusion protein)
VSPRRLVVAVLLLLIYALVAFYSVRPPAVAVASVTRRDVAPMIQAVGSVEAKVVINVSNRIASRVVSMLVDQGDTIEAGQTLARLDDAQQQADLDRSEGSMRAADFQLRDLRLAPGRPRSSGCEPGLTARGPPGRSPSGGAKVRLRTR